MKSEMFLEGKRHKLQAVLHGDARSNNMLFKYDCEGRQPIGVKLVDFQVALSTLLSLILPTSSCPVFQHMWIRDITWTYYAGKVLVS